MSNFSAFWSDGSMDTLCKECKSLEDEVSYLMNLLETERFEQPLKGIKKALNQLA